MPSPRHVFPHRGRDGNWGKGAKSELPRLTGTSREGQRKPLRLTLSAEATRLTPLPPLPLLLEAALELGSIQRQVLPTGRWLHKFRPKHT